MDISFIMERQSASSFISDCSFSLYVFWSLLLVCVSPKFLDHIVDEDVPLPAQILSLGCECFFIYVHVYFVDGDRANEKKLMSRKRCTYLFRLGMLSLTVFCTVVGSENNSLFLGNSFLDLPVFITLLSCDGISWFASCSLYLFY